MAKAMDSFNAGKISGIEVAQCEGRLNAGLDIPAHIKAKVLG
jgi:reverse gyrase